jgi:hypothetical protein
MYIRYINKNISIKFIKIILIIKVYVINRLRFLNPAGCEVKSKGREVSLGGGGEPRLTAMKCGARTFLYTILYAGVVNVSCW